MDLAVLFWFYKQVDVCENRLALLRQRNGDLRVYGLYGGDAGDAPGFEARLGTQLDDFYMAPPADAEWKWLNGDLMLLEWYERRGRDLAWDQIAVVQWDLLVLDAIHRQLPGMEAGEIFLSGLSALDAEVERNWYWTRDPARRPNYLQFRQYVRDHYGHDREPRFCFFIFQVFPRAFFERYAAVPGKEIGMLEYKVPTYAEIFGIPFYQRDLGGDAVLNPDKREISDEYIRQELDKPDGRRLFHPYYRIWG